MAEPLKSPTSPLYTKMADIDIQNGHMVGNGSNNSWTAETNGDSNETANIVIAKQVAMEPNIVFGENSSAISADVMSQLAGVPSCADVPLGGAVVDMEPIDSVEEASTASLTPTSPPHDSCLAGFDNGGFDGGGLPEAASSVQHDVTLFGNTGSTLEELGVQEAPPPEQGLQDNATNGQNGQQQMAVQVEPEIVPQHQNGAEAAILQSPASPSKKSRESKLPKMTPPGSPKKKPTEAPPLPPDDHADDKLFHKVALPPEAHMQMEPSGGARPKTAPAAKQHTPVEEPPRPGSAPHSKIPSPKKERNQERTPVSTPKKQDVASDSGIEEDRTASPRSRTPASSDKKRYGIDSKNAAYKPSGGNIKIFEKKMDVKSVGAKIDNKPTPKKADGSPRTRPGAYTPEIPRSKKLTETIKTMTPSPNTKAASSRIGSLANTKHTPGGGKVKIVSKKEDFSTVTAKCGSTANMKHTPGGGGKKIEQRKLEWNVTSKVGSLEKSAHKPGGGDKKIESHKIDFRGTATSKVGSTKNMKHKPGGGDKMIEKHKVDFRENATAKVGSTKNADYIPTGGDKVIETHKVDFREKATARTNHGISAGQITAAAAADST